MFDIGNVWDFDLMWDTFAYILKIVSPFLMIIIAILGVGALLYMVVVAVKKAVEK
ncbi:PTS ascorbate transporter subunit IIC [Lysinibacillus sp. D3C2_S12]|uniref:PTS ascorbate transporter subunit IIC n=1 Tax=Lysinibacillus sp. D3C2_S12 TaxID=2941226 RepID=UPI0020BD7AE6|nr:PTS ascorbate transporter subunit IIC [Lysinibacillus sp. D3C2_S12]